METALDQTSSYLENPEDNLISENAQGYYLRATMRLKENRTEDAITDLKIAKGKDPDYAFSYWLLGLTYTKNNKALAITELKQAAKLFHKQGITEMENASIGSIEKIRTSV